MEDREIKATSRNLIIHGIVEDVKDTQEGRERDKLFVSNIMSSSMGLNVKIKKTQRIGIFAMERQEKKNYRPIKITMENESLKTQVLQNLKKLNGIKNIKVTEDLTEKKETK